MIETAYFVARLVPTIAGLLARDSLYQSYTAYVRSITLAFLSEMTLLALVIAMPHSVMETCAAFMKRNNTPDPRA
jgi:hypothetical protein